MEDDKAGSEHTLPSASSKISLSDSKKKKKPCEKCGSNTNDSTSVRCCAKLLLQLAAKPDDGKDTKETANSGPKHLPSSPVSKETSPVSKQKQSDSDMPSGSESA